MTPGPTALFFDRLAGGRDRVLSLLALTLPLSLAGSNILWALAAALSIPLALRAGFRYRWTGLELPWAAVLVTILVSALLSAQPAQGVRAFKPEILAVLFVMASQTGSPETARRRLVFFVCGAAVAGAVGAVQWMSGFDRGYSPSAMAGWPGAAVRALSAKEGRALGLFSNAITYAEVLIIAVMAALGGWRAGRGKRWLVLGGVAGLGLLFSQTRGVWLGLAVGLTGWMVVQRDKKIIGLWLAGVFAAGLILTTAPNLRARVASMGDQHANHSNQIRLGLWAKSIDLIRAHPLLGVGPKQVRIRPEELRWGGSEPNKIWTETHNMYLQAGVERGVVGLGVFLWFLIVLGRTLWSAQKRDPALAGVFWGFIGLLVAGLTESWFNDSEVVMALYFVAGTALRGWTAPKYEKMHYRSERMTS